jgi:hypothetical protein
MTDEQRAAWHAAGMPGLSGYQGASSALRALGLAQSHVGLTEAEQARLRGTRGTQRASWAREQRSSIDEALVQRERRDKRRAALAASRERHRRYMCEYNARRRGEA